MLVEKKITELAYIHAKEILDFSNVLCQSLLHHRADFLLNASGYSYADGSVNISQRDELSSGGICLKTPDYLSSYLINKYKKEEEIYLLVDDVMLKKGDAIECFDGINTFYVGHEVYHWCSLNHVTPELLRKLIWSVNVPWHFVCLVFTVEDLRTNVDNQFIETYVKNKLIGINIMEVILGAYDGEGFAHYVTE